MNPSIGFSLLLILGIGSTARGQAGITGLDWDNRAHFEGIKQIQRLQRQDDGRLSAFLRLWMYYLNDPQFVMSAEANIQKGILIAEDTQRALICGNSPSADCLQLIGCKKQPIPYAPQCERHTFRFNEGLNSNVYIQSYSKVIDTRKRDVWAITVPYLIEADDLAYYGLPEICYPDPQGKETLAQATDRVSRCRIHNREIKEKIPFLIAASLLAQNEMANPAVRNSNWSEYYYQNPDPSSADEDSSRITFEKFVLIKARKLVESRYNISLLDPSSKYSERIDAYLHDRDNPTGATITVDRDQFISSQEDVDLSAGLPVENRYVAFQMAAKNLEFKFTFDCSNQKLGDMVYQLPLCNRELLAINPTTGLVTVPGQLQANINSQELVKKITQDHLNPQDPGADVGVVLDVAMVVLPLDELLAAAKNIFRWSSFLLDIKYLKLGKAAEGAEGIQKLSQGMKTAKWTAVMKYPAFVEKYLELYPKSFFVVRLASPLGLFELLTPDVRSFVYKTIFPDDALEEKNAQVVNSASQDFERAVQSGDPTQLRVSYMVLNSTIRTLLERNKYNGRNMNIHFYSRDRYQ